MIDYVTNLCRLTHSFSSQVNGVSRMLEKYYNEITKVRVILD